MADFFDRFQGAAGLLSGHTADSGETWSDPLGGLSIDASGSVYESSGPANYDNNTAVSSWIPPGADYAVKLVVGGSYPAVSNVTAFGPIVRLTGTPGNYSSYFLQIYSASGVYKAHISRWDFATAETIIAADTTIATIIAGDVVELQVANTGSPTPTSQVTLTARVNGAVIVTGTDTSAGRLTGAGKISLRVTNQGAGGTDMCRAMWAGAIGGPAQGVTPPTASVNYGATQGFTATGGLPSETLNWTVTSGTRSPTSGTSTTYTAPGSGSSATVTWTSADLPTHTAAAAVTLLSSGLASAFALTGPSAGFNHNASSNFTFTPNGNYTGTITPTMTGLAGTWAPTSLSWSGTAIAQTATFTPSAPGSGNANGTASPTLTAPANVAYTSNAQTLGVTPGALPTSATTPEIFYGGGTFWLTSAPTFTPSGTVAGISCGAVTVISNIEAHANVTTGTATGTFTWTDSTTGATALETVAAIVNVLSIVQGLAPGLSTVGYAIYDEDGSLLSTWTSIGVTERGTGSGNYGATVAIPTGTFHEIRWSNNNIAPFFPDVVNLAASTGTSGGPVTLAASGVDAVVIESGINLRQAVSLALAALAGKASGLNTNAPVFKGAGTNTTRIAAATDPNGNRTTVTLTPPA